MERKFGWVSVETKPKEGQEVLLAIADKEHNVWLYEIGGYFKKGYKFKIGKRKQAEKDGYYIYSSKYNCFLEMINTCYWSYIEEPLENDNVLIIYKEY